MPQHVHQEKHGQRCSWCGENVYHYAECRASDETRQAVADFARANGRTWKAKLRALWTAGTDEGWLRRARNVIGPSNLDRIDAITLAPYREKP